jgi:hypothetical protein
MSNMKIYFLFIFFLHSERNEDFIHDLKTYLNLWIKKILLP